VERALFLCRELGVDGYGFTADIHNNLKIRIREIPACVSAVIDAWILHPTPVLGKKEKI
jgi:vancomycin permeability regulator SanA